jgi:micrococcal nuclease
LRLAALLLVLLLAACGDGAALDRLAPAGRARVVEVVAPDLVTLDDGATLKLAGLASFPTREPYASEARAELERLTLGKEVELLTGGAPRDPFGRKVAHLRLVKGRRWVQGEMLEAGAGRVRTFSDQRALAREMLAREAKARLDGRGLWALPAWQVRLPWELRTARGFQIVEGRVSAVHGSELDLQGLAVSIQARAIGDFEAASRGRV